METLGQCANGGAQLLLRGFANGINARRALAALVQRRVDVGHPAGHRAAQILAHGADVHADDGVDLALVENVLGLFREIGNLVRRVHHPQAHFLSEQAAAAVDLLRRESRARYRRRAPDPGRTGGRDQQPDREHAVPAPLEPGVWKSSDRPARRAILAQRGQQ